MKNFIKYNKCEFLLYRECILFFYFTKIARNYSINFIFIHDHPRLRLLYKFIMNYSTKDSYYL